MRLRREAETHGVDMVMQSRFGEPFPARAGRLVAQRNHSQSRGHPTGTVSSRTGVPLVGDGHPSNHVIR
jgi:hypothetical protein